MPTRQAKARWEGSLEGGEGQMSLPTGGYEGPYTFASRFEEGEGTNPEELIAAAQAGCYSMFLSGLLSNAGYTPNSIATTADVTIEELEGAPTISRIALSTEADVPDVSEDEFNELAMKAKDGCPVANALRSVNDITLEAKLVS